MDKEEEGEEGKATPAVLNLLSLGSQRGVSPA